MKISVITPNYNYARYIGKTIESVVSQDHDNFEHIIVDDGSTDNSVDVIKSYRNKFPERIKLIQQENKGQTTAVNVALKHVTGDIVGWINSDDTFCKNAFKNIVQAFNKNPQADAVFGDIKIIDDQNNVIRDNKYLKFNYLSAVFIGFGKEISSNAIFWKKELSDSIYSFDESFIYAMDSEYWSRLLYKTKVKKINVPIANFRWHELAKTIRIKDKKESGYNKVKEERNIIMKKSYNRLFLSRIIPFKYSKPLYYLFRFRRLFLRGIKGEYFKRSKL